MVGIRINYVFKRTIPLVALALLFQFVCPFRSSAAGEKSYEFKDVCIYHPDPAWWSLARRGMYGKVVCQLQIDPKTGEVTEVKVVHKTRFQQLNAECVMTCFKWKFKPGTVTQMNVPFELELKGYAREVH